MQMICDASISRIKVTIWDAVRDPINKDKYMWGGGKDNKKDPTCVEISAIAQRDRIQQAQLFLACCCLHPVILNNIHT